MSLYLLAVTPLTLYAACALLRDQPPPVPFALWRRFALGGLLALPGFLGAGFVAGWFGSSYRPAALFARLTTIQHLLPAVLAVAAALAVGLPSVLARRRHTEAPVDTLAVLATMAGFGSVFLAVEFVSSGIPSTAMQLLIVPTLRVATLVALVFAWTRREHPLAAMAIAASAVLFAGAVSYLHAIGFPAPAAVLSGVAAAGGAAALLAMRGSS